VHGCARRYVGRAVEGRSVPDVNRPPTAAAVLFGVLAVVGLVIACAIGWDAITH